MSRPELDAGVVKSRALAGVKAMGGLAVLSQLVRMGSLLIVARLLDQEDYGIFGAVAYISAIGMFFGDVGLKGALVRQPEAPTRDEELTVFLFQQMLAGLTVLVILSMTPVFISTLRLPPAAAPMLAALAMGMFLSSLRVVPQLLLERELKFPTIARCEFIANTSATIGTIVLAVVGVGAWALVGGVLIQGAVLLAGMWTATRWRPAGRFRLPIVKQLARFGLPFQLNAIVPALAAGWTPFLVTRFLSVGALGFVNFANSLASTPQVLSNTLARVAFPTYSRLQTDERAFIQSLRGSIRRLTALLCVLVPLFIILAPVAIPILFGDQWRPAASIVQWFSVAFVFTTLTGILASVQNATAKAGQRLIVTIAIGALFWIVGYFAIRAAGLEAVGPVMSGVCAFELALTAYLVERMSPAHAGLSRDALVPIASSLVILVLALLAGQVVGDGRSMAGVGLSLVVFAVLTAARDAFSDDNALSRELTALVRMLRPAPEPR